MINICSRKKIYLHLFYIIWIYMLPCADIFEFYWAFLLDTQMQETTNMWGWYFHFFTIGYNICSKDRCADLVVTCMPKLFSLLLDQLGRQYGILELSSNFIYKTCHLMSVQLWDWVSACDVTVICLRQLRALKHMFLAIKWTCAVALLFIVQTSHSSICLIILFSFVFLFTHFNPAALYFTIHFFFAPITYGR